MRRRPNKQNQKQEKRRLRELCLRKSDQATLLLDENGHPIADVISLKISTGGSFSSDFHEAATKGKPLPPRYHGHICLRKKYTMSFDKNYCLYIRTRFTSQISDENKEDTPQTEMLFTGVRIFHQEGNKYQLDAYHQCGLSNSETPWEKIERMCKADKDSYKPHKNRFTGGHADIAAVMKAPRFIPANDHRFDNISTPVQKEEGPETVVPVGEIKAYDMADTTTLPPQEIE